MATAPTAAPAVEVRALQKRFGAIRALDGLALTVARGEFLAIFGPNGAGKTTLVRILGTLARPTSGQVWLFGRRLEMEATRLRRRIGLVSHRSFLYGALTAYENLRFYARLHGVADAAQRVRQLLADVGLQSRMHDPVATYSHGMLQRCAIARALVHDPELLLMDEPFAGLDPDAVRRLLGLLERLRRGDRTVLLTSHDLGRGAELADRVAFLVAGRLAYEAPRDDAVAEGLDRLYRSVAGGPPS